MCDFAADAETAASAILCRKNKGSSAEQNSILRRRNGGLAVRMFQGAQSAGPAAHIWFSAVKSMAQAFKGCRARIESGSAESHENRRRSLRPRMSGDSTAGFRLVGLPTTGRILTAAI